jgi:hypothetical protein
MALKYGCQVETRIDDRFADVDFCVSAVRMQRTGPTCLEKSREVRSHALHARFSAPGTRHNTISPPDSPSAADWQRHSFDRGPIQVLIFRGISHDRRS